MKNKHLLVLFLVAILNVLAYSQDDDDLLALLGEDEFTDYTNASFKTNRVINLHSLENTAFGVMDFKINHRFNTLSDGLYDLFGLDGATIRLAFDYGLTDRLQIGVARSTIGKTYDGYAKYKILRQSTGAKKMPLSLILVAASDVTTLTIYEYPEDFPFWNRFNYIFQGLIGRKFNENFSLELVPTLVHRNFVKTRKLKNDVFSLGIGMRQKLTKRVALNLEYIYVPEGQIDERYENSLSIGLDIETGGHVFQLHITNSRAMFESGFITQSTGKWLDGEIHLGFNLSRVFTLKEKKLVKKELPASNSFL